MYVVGKLVKVNKVVMLQYCLEVMSDSSERANYDRDRVKGVISRVRRTGGLPWGPAQIETLTSWFRTLVARGLTNEEVFAQEGVAISEFSNAFPNPVSRAQYVRAFLNYLSGLTDEEFSHEYTVMSRDELVNQLKTVSYQANAQRRADQTRTF